ncbi:MAG: methyltransferase domain-containing protein [archaeon]
MKEYIMMYQEFTSRAAAAAQHLESKVVESERILIMPMTIRAQRIYDLGTGAGRVPKYLAKQGLDAKIIGVESNRQMFLLANEFQSQGIMFVHSDIKDWLITADRADLMLCLGNTFGGFIDERYRNSLIVLIYKKLQNGGNFILDYRPINAVLKNDSVLSRHSQAYGELVMTREDISGSEFKLVQFYPDEPRLIDFLKSNGFRPNQRRYLEGTKYMRKAIILRKE